MEVVAKAAPAAGGAHYDLPQDLIRLCSVFKPCPLADVNGAVPEYCYRARLQPGLYSLGQFRGAPEGDGVAGIESPGAGPVVVLTAAGPVFDPSLKHSVLANHIWRDLLQCICQFCAEVAVNIQELRSLNAVREEVLDQSNVHCGTRCKEHLLRIAVYVITLLGRH